MNARYAVLVAFVADSIVYDTASTGLDLEQLFARMDILNAGGVE